MSKTPYSFKSKQKSNKWIRCRIFHIAIKFDDIQFAIKFADQCMAQEYFRDSFSDSDYQPEISDNSVCYDIAMIILQS